MWKDGLNTEIGQLRVPISFTTLFQLFLQQTIDSSHTTIDFLCK